MLDAAVCLMYACSLFVTHTDIFSMSSIAIQIQDQVSNDRYRIAGSFLGPYISRIAIKFIFAETNFVHCMIKATPTLVSLAAVSWL